jgi:hypothetical protein
MTNEKNMRILSAFGSMACACGFLMLGAPSPVRAQSDADSRMSQDQNNGADENGKVSDGRDEEARRQALRRRSLNSRGAFDPRVYEARGRELQGEVYEINAMANPPSWSPSPRNIEVADREDGREGASEAIEAKESSHGFWLWASALAAAGAAGAVGYYFLGQDQGTPAPRDVNVTLNDKP